MKFIWNSFVIPSLVIKTIWLSLSDLCWEEKRIFKEIRNFIISTLKVSPHYMQEVIRCTISCLSSQRTLHIKFGKDWSNGSWEDVNGPDDTRRRTQPMVFGILSDSGELITMKVYYWLCATKKIIVFFSICINNKRKKNAYYRRWLL